MPLCDLVVGTEEEIHILGGGLAVSAAGLICIGYAPQPVLLYFGLALLALGSCTPAGRPHASTSASPLAR